QDTARKIRRLLTTLSMDYDRPAVTPWARFDLSATPGYVYQLAGPYPTGGPMPFPTMAAQLYNNGEFGSDARAFDAGMGKIDLNRQLAPYPPPPPIGPVPGTDAQLL